ncbi:hypothetical protein HID58_088904 [Brassica napus]|uniref:Pentatricopeptide repeat-containing protein n=1 Tax=Brassica napus TaxID=3708 RepID=A0ABQ7XXH2_BRANA|nr:hypothetical protein HID58_088904 [Brassica napus]
MNLLPEDYTARFHMIENVSIQVPGELPENLRGEFMYTALLNNLDRAKAAFKKMRELGFLLKPLPYSSTTLLYSSVGNRGKVDEILRGMNENNVKLDSLTRSAAGLTVNSILQVYAAESDVRSMEKLLAGCEVITMLHLLTWCQERSKRASEVKDHESYEELMRLYVKHERVKMFTMYYKEYEWSGLEFDVRFPTMLVSGFHKKGMMKQADILMKKNRRCDNKPITSLLKKWEKIGNRAKPSHLRNLIKSLSDSNKFSKALEASSVLCEKEVKHPNKIKGYAYATFLNTCTRCYQNVNKAEAIFEKMGELGFLSKLFLFKYGQLISKLLH